ncbi:hypothetical protein [Escherichia phage UPEC06]|nr:hypothetical protein [Escherichia phage UPEC06]
MFAETNSNFRSKIYLRYFPVIFVSWGIFRFQFEILFEINLRLLPPCPLHTVSFLHTCTTRST